MQVEAFHEYIQRREYDCGPYALSFLLMLHGIHISGEKIFSSLSPGPTPDAGTPPEMIEDWLTRRGYTFDHSFSCPSLVNFTFEGDAHWGVVTSCIDERVTIFEPWYGEIVRIPKDEFDKNWRGLKSKCYSLTITGTPFEI